jgi:hypothetical protein
MNFLKTTYLLIPVSIVLLFTASCQSIKPYQRAYLNDRDMQFKNAAAENMELKAQAYREAAAGTGKGKSSGGCGCK